jgi:hypothetical protein
LVEAILRLARGDQYVDPELGAQLAVTRSAPALEPISGISVRNCRC